MSRARLILGDFDGDESREEGTYDPHNVSLISLGCEPPKTPTGFDCTHTTTTCRVQTKQSPYMDTFCGEYPLRITIDSGAETNLIRTSTAKVIGAKITNSTQSAMQADGSSPLKVHDETTIHLTRDDLSLKLHALVVDDIDVQCTTRRG